MNFSIPPISSSVVIRTLTIYSGLSVRQLAEQAGISYTTILNVLNKKNQLGPVACAKLELMFRSRVIEFSGHHIAVDKMTIWIMVSKFKYEATIKKYEDTNRKPTQEP